MFVELILLDLVAFVKASNCCVSSYADCGSIDSSGFRAWNISRQREQVTAEIIGLVKYGGFPFTGFKLRAALALQAIVKLVFTPETIFDA